MFKMVNRRKIRAYRKMKFWRRRKTDLSRPRLCIFRSCKHIQAQVIDDSSGNVLAAASSVEASFKSQKLNGSAMAALIGRTVAERSKIAGVKTVVFDRNGYAYHGRVAFLAEAAREGGLSF